jgi:signal transduction histidine kinase
MIEEHSKRFSLTRFYSLAWVFLFALLPLAPAHGLTRLVDALALLEPAGSEGPPHEVSVKLPFNWDAAQGSVDGRAQLLLTFEAPDPATPSALFTRIGNTFTVKLNGTHIAGMGQIGNRYQDFGKEPQFIRIPAGVLKAQNTLEITLHALGQRHAGLVPVVFGPAEPVYAEYRRAYRLRIAAAFAIAVISLSLGALSLLLWVRQREQLYLFYGLGDLLWALHISDTLFQTAPLPWPWWGIVTFSAYMMAGVFICKFSLALLDAHKGAIKTITDWHLLLTLPLAALTIAANVPLAWRAWQGVTVIICCWTGVLVVRHGFRAQALEKRVLAMAAAVTAGAALRDFVVIKMMPDAFGEIAWVRFAWVIYAITLAWVIAERLRKSTEALEKLNNSLSTRLAEREKELKEVFSRQIAADRRQAAAEERQRLTRDMHDGIGSQLAGTLLLAQDPAFPRLLITEHIRDALDNLKLTVDAMQEADGDIATILGALRYRLGPRLQACGLALKWHVQPLPLVDGWSIQHARHLQLILFEAFSNIMAHARATEAELCALYENEHQGGSICIGLRDNGRGFAPGELSVAGGQGLTNMRIRAEKIQASLEVDSDSSGTRITIRLPLANPKRQAHQ